MTWKPLLAPSESVDTATLSYPVMCSPKLDGIRCIIKDGVAMSRSLIPLPSIQVQESLKDFEHLDGELIIGEPTKIGCYNLTQSHIMARDKPGLLTFYVFDYTHPNILHRPFYERHNILYVKTGNVAIDDPDVSIVVLKQTYVSSEKGLLEYEAKVLAEGYEGIMIRDPAGYYKQGRATIKEGIIYKLKRFCDDEGTIVGFTEAMTNMNTAEVDALGHTKRSTSKANMVPAGTLGNFIVNYKGAIIDVAPGLFTHHDREVIWNFQGAYLGKLLKFRYFSYGVKDKPRFPRAIGMRNAMDR